MATGKTKGVDHKYIGSITPKQLQRLTLQVQAAMLDIEKEIAKATKGIDPTREQDIQFAVANLVSKWHSGEKKAPQSVFKLNLLLRAAPDKESRGLQIASTVLLPKKHGWAGPLGHLIPRTPWGNIDKHGQKLSISGKRDFTKTLLVNKNLIGNPQGIYETLDKLNKLHRTLNDIQGTKYSQNIDTTVLKEYGIKLDANKGSMTPVNAYYLSSRDLSLKGAHIVDRDNEREAFKTEFPLEYAANPGKFRYNLDQRNFYSKRRPENNNNVEGNQYGPLNTINGKYKKGDFRGNWRKGEEVWTGRGSGRSVHQANADTRALLIKKGANARQVNLLSNDDLSRYRISGGLESKGRLQLLGDNRVTLKLDKNRQFNSGDYGITNDMSGNQHSTVLPKVEEVPKKEELTINNKKTNKESNVYSGPGSKFLKDLSATFD